MQRDRMAHAMTVLVVLSFSLASVLLTRLGGCHL